VSRNRAVALTACVAVLVPGFLTLGWWQLTRALSGNSLSWAYTFEWPLFAGYLVWVWWRLLHEDRASVPGAAAGATDAGGPAGPAPGEEEDEELAAYNRYLAALEESGRRKRW
jgi:hypothetical protein